MITSLKLYIALGILLALLGTHLAAYWHGKTVEVQKGWQARAQDEEAAREAVQKQLAQVTQERTHNDEVIRGLQTQNAAIAADRDTTRTLVQRLLSGTTRSAASGIVPKAGSQPAAVTAGPAQGDAVLEGLLIEAHDECSRNANQLDSLVAELQPQL